MWLVAVSWSACVAVAAKGAKGATKTRGREKEMLALVGLDPTTFGL